MAISESRHASLPRALGGIGTNRETRLWYSRYASPFERTACASVGGMPIYPKIDARMIACGAIAISPHVANVSPYTAYPTHTDHSKK